jgi:lipoprotein signal peptidase
MVIRAGPLHTGVFNLADFVIVLGILMLTAFGARNGKVHHDL